MVAQVVFIVAGQILFALNIVSANFVKRKSIAQILHIGANGHMVDFFFETAECVSDISCRGQI